MLKGISSHDIANQTSHASVNSKPQKIGFNFFYIANRWWRKQLLCFLSP